MKKVAKAFTLVEILVAMSIAIMAIGLTLVFFVRSLRDYSYATGRLTINKDVRRLTESMTMDAVASNFFRIYPAFDERTTSGGVDAVVADGLSGDCLFLFTESTDSSGVSRITRVICYYRDGTVTKDTNGIVISSTPGPVRRVEWTSSTGVDPCVNYKGSAFTVLSFLNDIIPVSSKAANPQVIQIAQGLGNGRLFYNFYSRGIIVRGQVEEDDSKSVKTVNTYNFTISPRG